MLLKKALSVSSMPNPQCGFHCMVNGNTLHTRLHTHDCYECNIMLEGCVKNNSEGLETVLMKGEAIFLAPGEAHQMAAVSDTVPKILTLMAMPAEFEDFIALFGSSVTQAFCAKTHKIALSAEEAAQLDVDFQKLYFLEEDKKTPLIKVMFCQMLCALSRRLYTTAPDGKHKKLAEALRQMSAQENMAQGVGALIRLSGLSRGHLYRLMREEYHTTPLAYVTQLRMNYASNLLLYSDHDILTVAMEVGYFSISHFISQFKKCFGMPPKQYKIKNRPDF